MPGSESPNSKAQSYSKKEFNDKAKKNYYNDINVKIEISDFKWNNIKRSMKKRETGAQSEKVTGNNPKKTDNV